MRVRFPPSAVVQGSDSQRVLKGEMDRETWDKVKDLIAEALRLPRSARDTFLQSRCPDLTLRSEIHTFLRAWSEMPTGFLEHARQIESVDTDDLPFGTQVGPYLIVGILEKGGMGQVFLGEDVRLHRKVALKRLLDSRRGNVGERAVILREARAAAQINHPAVATVYDVIEHETRAFIVMEYLEGESLSTLMRRERLSLERAVHIGRQLATALVAAHAKGVIHRDVKPANIQVTGDGSVKMLDFGVAAATAAFTTVSSDDLVNETAAQPGTPGYMSPEQMLNHHIDERSDVFSLGLVLFEMATGEPAYFISERRELEAAVLRPVRRANVVNHKVPRELADLIAKALIVDPAARLQSASLAAAALERLHKRYFMAAVFREGLRDALSTVVVSLRGSYSVARYLLTFAPIPAAMIGALTGFGLLNSQTFNHMLERSDFASETVSDWLKIGMASSVAPAALVILGFLTLVGLAFIRNIAVALSPKARGLDATFRHRFRQTAHRWHLDNVSVLTSFLLVASASVLMSAWWYFYPMIHAILAHASTASASDLALMSPSSRVYQVRYREIFSAISISFVILWYQVARTVIRTDTSRNWGLLAGGLTITLLAVASLQLPWRLFFRANFEAVRWKGADCYIIGERPADVLLFCPELGRRVSTERKPTDGLERTGREGNVFARFSQR